MSPFMKNQACSKCSPAGQRTLRHRSDVLETVVLVNPCEGAVVSEVLLTEVVIPVMLIIFGALQPRVFFNLLNVIFSWHSSASMAIGLPQSAEPQLNFPHRNTKYPPDSRHEHHCYQSPKSAQELSKKYNKELNVSQIQSSEAWRALILSSQIRPQWFWAAVLVLKDPLAFRSGGLKP